MGKQEKQQKKYTFKVYSQAEFHSLGVCVTCVSAMDAYRNYKKMSDILGNLPEICLYDKEIDWEWSVYPVFEYDDWMPFSVPDFIRAPEALKATADVMSTCFYVDICEREEQAEEYASKTCLIRQDGYAVLADTLEKVILSLKSSAFGGHKVWTKLTGYSYTRVSLKKVIYNALMEIFNHAFEA